MSALVPSTLPASLPRLPLGVHPVPASVLALVGEAVALARARVEAMPPEDIPPGVLVASVSDLGGSIEGSPLDLVAPSERAARARVLEHAIEVWRRPVDLAQVYEGRELPASAGAMAADLWTWAMAGQRFLRLVPL